MQQNDISIIVPKEAADDILATAELLRTKIAVFSKTISDAERAGYFKLGDARLAFDQKCDAYIHQHPELVPFTISVPEYDKDGAAMDVFNSFSAKISTINSLINDTLVVLGADRLAADLAFYNWLPMAADAGLPSAENIHKDLQDTYPGGRQKSVKPAPKPVTP